MAAFYNEIDPFAAAWLRELIAAGHIAPGDVDERDIRDVRPDDLVGYTQCHFFAGIGVWSHALRRAGWPDDRPVWTASCPCQPFSEAGQGKGFADERHLWPTFNDLRTTNRPVVAIGEQVASRDGLAWLDLVQADVEASGDAFGAIDLCSAGFGAPHIRQRLHWMAVAQYTEWGAIGSDRENGRDGPDDRREEAHGIAGACGEVRSLADAPSGGCGEFQHALGQGRGGHVDCGCEPVGLADVHSDQPGRIGTQPLGSDHDAGRADRPAPTNGLWRDADWLGCRDGKWRPVEPGTFPLAHGAPARVGRLRGYGNAINAEVATGFIEAVIATLAEAA